MVGQGGQSQEILRPGLEGDPERLSEGLEEGIRILVCSFCNFPEKSKLSGHRILFRSYLLLKGKRAKPYWVNWLGTREWVGMVFRVGEVYVMWPGQPFRLECASGEEAEEGPESVFLVRMPPTSPCI